MASYKNLLQLLESFEHALGDPHHPLSPVNFKQLLQNDEDETLPWQAMECIQNWGYMDFLVPEYLGGKLHSIDELYELSKLIARRDITTAIALGLSFLAALPTWIAGTNKQKKQLAQRIFQREISALALTEEDHGSDLTSNEVTAIVNDQGWSISGEKWCINFATLGHSVTLLCRTHKHAGLRGFSIFNLDKSTIQQGFTPTPRLLTHGVRGLDISGFRLDAVQLNQEALVGAEGKGLEIIYKTLQISRTLCASLSLGGADTALRLALSFSLQRQLYNKKAYDLPVVQQKLNQLLVLALAADCMSLVVARACTQTPEYMSLWSGIIKYFVPKIAVEVVEECAIILGARAYLRNTEWGIFQKIRRDIQVVGLFDGSSQVNLSIITGHLIAQAESRKKTDNIPALDLAPLFDIQQECPAFKEETLSLFTTKTDIIVAGLQQLQSPPLNRLRGRVVGELKAVDEAVLHLRDTKTFEPRSTEAFALADKYCRIFAAACCLQFWFYNQNTLSKELQLTEWLDLAVASLLKIDNHEEPVTNGVSEMLLTYYQENKLFSVRPVQLGV